MNELVDVVFLQRWMNNQYTEGTRAQFKDLPNDLQLTNLLKAKGKNGQPIAMRADEWDGMTADQQNKALAKAAKEA